MAIDQSARLGENIEQSAETIGKALDKPSQGVTALTKQGFKFTEQQKQQMKVMEATGRTAEAQQIVLDAMAESYAGAAAAARNTFGGALTAVGNSLRDLLDGSGSANLSGVTQALNELAQALAGPEIKAAFSQIATGVLGAVAAFAKFMAQDGVGYLRRIISTFVEVVRHAELLAVAVGTTLAGRAVPALIAGVRIAIGWLVSLRAGLFASTTAAQGLKAALATVGGPVTLAITALTTALYYLYQRTQDAKEAAEEHARVLKQVKDLSKQSRDAAFELAAAKRNEAIETLRAAKAHLEAARYESQATGFAAGGGGPLGGARVSLGENDPRVTRAKAMADVAQKSLDEIDAALFYIMTTGIDQILKPVVEGAEGGATAIAKSNATMLDAVRRSLAELDRLAGYAQGSPEHTAALAGLQEIDTQIGTIAASQQIWRQKIEDTAGSAFGDFLADLTTGTKSFNESFSDMVKSFVAGVARMVAQEAALRGISALFGSWGQGASGSAQGTSTVVAGKRHTGGRVPADATPNLGSPLRIGSGYSQFSPNAAPRIMFVGIWSRVLSDDEVAAQYRQLRDFYGNMKGVAV